MKIDIYNADHPARKKAIRIIEVIEGHINKCLAKGEEYYQIEDELTSIIAEKK